MVSSSSRVKLLGQKMRNYRWSLTDLLPAIFKLFSPYLTPVPLGHEHGIDRTPETRTQVTLTLTFFCLASLLSFAGAHIVIAMVFPVRKTWDGDENRTRTQWQNSCTWVVYDFTHGPFGWQITSEWQFRQKYGGKKGSLVSPKAKSALIKTLHPANLKTKQIPCVFQPLSDSYAATFCFSVHINHGVICIHLGYYISRYSRIVVNVQYRLKIIKVKGRWWIPGAHPRGQCENFLTFLGFDWQPKHHIKQVDEPRGKQFTGFWGDSWIASWR